MYIYSVPAGDSGVCGVHCGFQDRSIFCWFSGSEEGSVVTCVLCFVSLTIFLVEKPTTVAWGPGLSIAYKNSEKSREITGQPTVLSV